MLRVGSPTHLRQLDHSRTKHADAEASAGAIGQELAAGHAMQLVRQGALRAAAHLGDALAAVGAHLPDMVASHTSPGSGKQPTALDCLAGTRSAGIARACASVETSPLGSAAHLTFRLLNAGSNASSRL